MLSLLAMSWEKLSLAAWLLSGVEARSSLGVIDGHIGRILGCGCRVRFTGRAVGGRENFGVCCRSDQGVWMVMALPSLSK